MQSSMKVTYIFSTYNVFKIIMLLQHLTFLFAIKLSSDFYKVQISTNYEKIILKFVFLARLGTILPVVREITHIKWDKKYNLRIKSGMSKISITI